MTDPTSIEFSGELASAAHKADIGGERIAGAPVVATPSRFYRRGR